MTRFFLVCADHEKYTDLWPLRPLDCGAFLAKHDGCLLVALNEGQFAENAGDCKRDEDAPTNRDA